MSKGNLYIDCTSGVSGDMLCQCLTDLCDNGSFVEEQQQLVSDELHHEAQHQADHGHGHGENHENDHAHADDIPPATTMPTPSRIPIGVFKASWGCFRIAS